MSLPLYMEVHDDCEAESVWIDRSEFARSYAEDGGALLCESDELRRKGLRDKRRSFTVMVEEGERVDVYTYRESHAVMHVAVKESEALILTLRYKLRPIDDSEAKQLAIQRLKEWWSDHGGLRKIQEQNFIQP